MVCEFVEVLRIAFQFIKHQIHIFEPHLRKKGENGEELGGVVCDGKLRGKREGESGRGRKLKQT